jgi:hypothetical protein
VVSCCKIQVRQVSGLVHSGSTEGIRIADHQNEQHDEDQNNVCQHRNCHDKGRIDNEVITLVVGFPSSPMYPAATNESDEASMTMPASESRKSSEKMVGRVLLRYVISRVPAFAKMAFDPFDAAHMGGDANIIPDLIRVARRGSNWTSSIYEIMSRRRPRGEHWLGAVQSTYLVSQMTVETSCTGM